jgi:hypothetical protein
VAVPQRLINLLNLPLPTLRRLARRAGIETNTDSRKWDVIERLAPLSERELFDAFGEWLYAGSTSITYLRIGDGRPLDPAAMREQLVDMCNGDPFERDVRPEVVTAMPQLVEAREWGDEKVLLTFAMQKRVTRVIHNFELTDVVADDFFVAVLRPQHAIVEVRGSHERANRIARSWLLEFADRL